MTSTIAMEWAQYNIRVKSVSPGLVKTAMTYWVPQQPDWEQQLKYYGGMRWTSRVVLMCTCSVTQPVIRRALTFQSTASLEFVSGVR
jgi:NAD(P)-dependent dehydrogenase (short-subunit alcohol dehydrogenase family)